MEDAASWLADLRLSPRSRSRSSSLASSIEVVDADQVGPSASVAVGRCSPPRSGVARSELVLSPPQDASRWLLKAASPERKLPSDGVGLHLERIRRSSADAWLLRSHKDGRPPAPLKGAGPLRPGLIDGGWH